jgi:predicted  nucleic acid-binding Zn-ribbon protein
MKGNRSRRPLVRSLAAGLALAVVLPSAAFAASGSGLADTSNDAAVGAARTLFKVLDMTVTGVPRSGSVPTRLGTIETAASSSNLAALLDLRGLQIGHAAAEEWNSYNSWSAQGRHEPNEGSLEVGEWVSNSVQGYLNLGRYYVHGRPGVTHSEANALEGWLRSETFALASAAGARGMSSTVEDDRAKAVLELDFGRVVVRLGDLLNSVLDGNLAEDLWLEADQNLGAGALAVRRPNDRVVENIVDFNEVLPLDVLIALSQVEGIAASLSARTLRDVQTYREVHNRLVTIQWLLGELDKLSDAVAPLVHDNPAAAAAAAALAAAEAELVKIVSDLAALTAPLNAAVTAVAAAQGVLTGAQADLAAAQATLGNQDAAVATATQAVASAQAAVASLQSQISAAQNQIATLQAQILADPLNAGAYLAQIAALESQISGWQASLPGAESNVTAAQHTLSAAQAARASAAQAVTAAQATASAAAADANAAAAAHEALVASQAALASAKVAAQATVASAQAAADAAVGQVIELLDCATVNLDLVGQQYLDMPRAPQMKVMAAGSGTTDPCVVHTLRELIEADLATVLAELHALLADLDVQRLVTDLMREVSVAPLFEMGGFQVLVDAEATADGVSQEWTCRADDIVVGGQPQPFESCDAIDPVSQQFVTLVQTVLGVLAGGGMDSTASLSETRLAGPLPHEIVDEQDGMQRGSIRLDLFKLTVPSVVIGEVAHETVDLATTVVDDLLARPLVLSLGGVTPPGKPVLGQPMKMYAAGGARPVGGARYTTASDGSTSAPAAPAPDLAAQLDRFQDDLGELPTGDDLTGQETLGVDMNFGQVGTDVVFSPAGGDVDVCPTCPGPWIQDNGDDRVSVPGADGVAQGDGARDAARDGTGDGSGADGPAQGADPQSAADVMPGADLPHTGGAPAATALGLALLLGAAALLRARGRGLAPPG